MMIIKMDFKNTILVGLISDEKDDGKLTIESIDAKICEIKIRDWKKLDEQK
jgi:hypothetical protein